jgi:hypothetical protein
VSLIPSWRISDYLTCREIDHDSCLRDPYNFVEIGYPHYSTLLYTDIIKLIEACKLSCDASVPQISRYIVAKVEVYFGILWNELFQFRVCEAIETTAIIIQVL